MGNFIQIDPRMFDRGPRTSMLVGQAIGNTAQKAGDLFLQGKVQNMLARGQQRESAKGIASLYPREYQKQVEDAYSQVPLAYHGEGIKQAQEFMGAPGIDFSSGVPSSFLGRVGPTPMQPPQMQQPAQRAMYAPESMLEGPKPVQVEEKTQPPTSTAVAANIDALQRMGQGLPVANQQGQANVAANQFPPASGAQQPQAQPQPENIPLEDLTAPEVNGLLRMIPKKSDRDAFIKDVERAKKNSRAERDVSAREGKNIQSEKTFQYNKKQKEIDRAEENTKKFREGLSAKEETLPQRQQALDITIDAIQRGSLGPLSINHLASMFGMYGEDAKQLLSGVKTSLLSDLSPIGGKQNVYLEQMMAGSLPQIGTTQSGNLIATNWRKIRKK